MGRKKTPLFLGILAGSVLSSLQNGKSLKGCWAVEEPFTPCAKQQQAKVIYKAFFHFVVLCFLIKAVVLDSVLVKPSFKEK